MKNATLYLSAAPLDPSFGSVTDKIAASEAGRVRGRHNARLRQLMAGNNIVGTGGSDAFGRFKLQSLPAGDFYLIAIAESRGKYLVWQRRVSLGSGRLERVYLNRNNLALMTL